MMRYKNADGNFFRRPMAGMLVLSLAVSGLFAQQEEVRVVKPYTPTLSSAEKIQLLPSLQEDIEFEVPRFSYELFPRRYDSQFRVEPIKAARMVDAPLDKLYKSQLTLGMGNYLSPLAELRINQLRSRNGTFGLQVKHESMNGRSNWTTSSMWMRVPGKPGWRCTVNGSCAMRSSATKPGELPVPCSLWHRSGAGYPTHPEGSDRALLSTEAKVNLHSAHADSFHLNYKPIWPTTCSPTIFWKQSTQERPVSGSTRSFG
ncbi:MAG: hypothetical protein R2751_07715 [Bacteroidales bacterium]